MPAGGRRSGPALRAGPVPQLRQAVSPMDQDPECRPPTGSGTGGDHDVTRNQALQQRLPATFDVRRLDRHPDDAPSLNLGPVEPALHEAFERRLRRRLEAQDVHLPVALFPNQEAPGAIQTGYGVRTQEHFGQGVHEAARGRTLPAGARVSQRARRSALRRSRKSRTTR